VQEVSVGNSVLLQPFHRCVVLE